MPNEYKKFIKQINAQQQQPTQQRQSLKALTTKAIPKSFFNHIFEEPRATQCCIDNGLPPDHIQRYFNFAFLILHQRNKANNVPIQDFT